MSSLLNVFNGSKSKELEQRHADEILGRLKIIKDKFKI